MTTIREFYKNEVEAQTALKKLERQRRYYERMAAA